MDGCERAAAQTARVRRGVEVKIEGGLAPDQDPQHNVASNSQPPNKVTVPRRAFTQLNGSGPERSRPATKKALKEGAGMGRKWLQSQRRLGEGWMEAGWRLETPQPPGTQRATVGDAACQTTEALSERVSTPVTVSY